jgi:hypothetical protein
LEGYCEINIWGYERRTNLMVQTFIFLAKQTLKKTIYLALQIWVSGHIDFSMSVLYLLYQLVEKQIPFYKKTRPVEEIPPPRYYIKKKLNRSPDRERSRKLLIPHTKWRSAPYMTDLYSCRGWGGGGLKARVIPFIHSKLCESVCKRLYFGCPYVFQTDNVWAKSNATVPKHPSCSVPNNKQYLPPMCCNFLTFSCYSLTRVQDIKKNK